jgi:hypothetical protein
MGTTILILVLDLAATVKGPNAASDARLDTRPRRTTVLDGVDRRPPHNFHPRRATARSEWLVRSVNTGASHHCRIDRAGAPYSVTHEHG